MMINKISNINFKENTNTNIARDMNAQNAILMLRDPNASVKFQQNNELAHNADAINSNPIKALGYKLYKAFSIIRNNNSDITDVNESKSLDLIA